MGNNSHGFKNEDEMIKHLNGITISEAPEEFQNIIRTLLGDVDDDAIIHCTTVGKKSGLNQKPDLKITVDGQDINCSLKMGSGNSVHQEDINEFVNFLKSINFDARALDYLLEYHYADGTTDNTGTTRLSATDYAKQNADKVAYINEKLNEETTLKLLTDRFVFQGIKNDLETADVVIYGTMDELFWGTREEILEYQIEQATSTKSVQMGNLTYQVWNRALDFQTTKPKGRTTLQIKWGSLEKDLRKIEARRKDE